MGSRVILCLNSGSSSFKFALYRIGHGHKRIGDQKDEELLLAQGAVERENSGETQTARLWIHSPQGKIEKTISDMTSAPAALHAAASEIERINLPEPAAVGHRIVHGGPNHAAPERISPALLEDLRGLIPFAPLHLPDEIAAIEAVAATPRLADIPQIACFDTAFHHAMPEVARRFPIPRALWDQGVRRYGFHGISYEYIMRTLGDQPPARVIVAHLGNGASMAAVKDGRSLDTTMGFTPTGGFMMGTRSGDLDPGIVLYLMNEKKYDATALARLVNHESGLLGVSGVSSDMKTLLERRGSDDLHAAAIAIEMFCYELRKQIGAYAAALGGLDLMVFTGGIGERAAPVRWETCEGLEHLGISLDRDRNDANADTISAADSRCQVRVIPTNEDLMIARHTDRVCGD